MVAALVVAPYPGKAMRNLLVVAGATAEAASKPYSRAFAPGNALAHAKGLVAASNKDCKHRSPTGREQYHAPLPNGRRIPQ